MFFTENPFYRLGLHSRDEMASLLLREQQLTSEGGRDLEDLRLLLQIENRSEAEFYWLIGWEKKEALRAAHRIAEGKVYDRKDFEKKSPLSRMMIELNEMAMGHMSLARLLEIERDFTALSPLDAAKEIEEERVRAGFPRLEEPWVIEMWKQDLLSEIGRAALVSLSKIPLGDHEALLSALYAKGQRGMVYYQLLSDFEKRKFAPVKIPSLPARRKGKRNPAALAAWGALLAVVAAGLL